MDNAIRFFSTLLMLPLFMGSFFFVIRQMVMKEVEASSGALALTALFIVMAVSIASPNQWVAVVMLITLVSLMLFFPLAQTYLENQDLQSWNAEVIDRAHAEIAHNPNNIGAFFALAEALYDHGFQGHAILLASRTVESLDQAPADLGQHSMRAIFSREESRLKIWIREYGENSAAFRVLSCPKCGKPNTPDCIACAGCGAPYLLEIVRKREKSSSVVGRLILAWAAIAASIAIISFGAFLLQGPAMALALFGAIAAVGGIVSWLFRGSRPGSSFRSF